MTALAARGSIAAAMKASARRVRAERDRRRLPPRMRRTRWARRILGVLATGAFLAVGVDSARLIAARERPHASDAVLGAPPAAAQGHHARHKHRRARHGA